MSNNHEAQEFKINIPSGFNADTRREIAEQIIDRIVERTRKDMIDKDGKPFPPLSKDYKEMKQSFSGSSSPDLVFTGEMLGEMHYKVSRSSSTELVVGYDANTEQNAKAKGHITGDVGVKRNFLGLPQKEVDLIVAQFNKEPDKFNEISSIRGALKGRGVINLLDLESFDDEV